jgi:hypothetical protein
MTALAQTGTSALLDQLSPYLDDAWINECFPRQRGAGRRRAFTSGQLLRVHLLALLTPAHQFNLLLQLLPENRAWRRFARLPNHREVPDAKMLHQFRERLELIHLRRLNNYLVQPLLEQIAPSRLTLGIIDATDLPASANSFKKTKRVGPPSSRLSARVQLKAA